MQGPGLIPYTIVEALNIKAVSHTDALARTFSYEEVNSEALNLSRLAKKDKLDILRRAVGLAQTIHSQNAEEIAGAINEFSESLNMSNEMGLDYALAMFRTPTLSIVRPLNTELIAKLRSILRVNESKENVANQALEVIQRAQRLQTSAHEGGASS
jgi:hypothetical protein